MFARTGRFLVSVLALLFCVTAAHAQQDAQRAPGFTQQELDQILAPIALYPDALLSQILMAATYPSDVTEAAQWSRQNADLNGDRAVRAVERYDWDPSVKSLVAFPQILDMMDEKYNWMQDLGDAFLDQQAQVMDSVQYLRRKADVAGNLRSTEQMRVVVRDSSYVIEFANPQVVYLPYYNPVVVYGTWWWPTHQPVYWAPWPGYYARSGHRGYAWGPPIAVSRGFFYGAPDWRQRRITIVNPNNYYYRSQYPQRETPRTVVSGPPPVWQHDTARRGEVPRRSAAAAQPGARVEAPEWRGNRGREPQGTQNRATVAPPQPPIAAQPQTRIAPAAPGAAAPAAPTAPADTRRYDARDGRGDRSNDRAQRNDGRNDAANRPADRAPIQPAPAAPAAAVAPAPVPALTPAPAAATRGEPQRNAESRRNDTRDGRGDRSERGPRNESRNDAPNRAAERATVQPAPIAPPVAPPVAARAPIAAPAAPAVAIQPPVRVAPAPVAAPAPGGGAGAQPGADARANAARAPEAAARREARQQERGQPAPAENAVGAVPGSAPVAPPTGNARGEGNNRR